MPRLRILFWYCAACFQLAAVENPGLNHIDVFISGSGGYHTYRIPALVVSTNGTILAFCEGRKNGRGDSGDIDILLKRSADNGTNWSSAQVIWDDGTNTCGNPCPVVDEETGTILLLLTHNLGGDQEAKIKSKLAKNTRTVWLSRSTDDGKTWSKPENITSEAKAPSWDWYATGPGVGIQLKHGPRKGRLVIPCDHSDREHQIDHASHVIYSDDHGRTWQRGGSIQPDMNECQVVELADGQGTLLMNMRSYRGHASRAQSVSHDGGLTWTEPQDVPELVEPVCQASILRCTWPTAAERSRILFSNPANPKSRRNMTIRVSNDEGHTWALAKTIHPGFAAYSCLTLFPDGSIGCLYECGDKNANEKISLARFNLDWLEAR